MKQVKIAYEKCEAKMPKRPPDEIDFGLGFRAALGWIEKEREARGDNYLKCVFDAIEEELQ